MRRGWQGAIAAGASARVYPTWPRADFFSSGSTAREVEKNGENCGWSRPPMLPVGQFSIGSSEKSARLAFAWLKATSDVATMGHRFSFDTHARAGLSEGLRCAGRSISDPWRRGGWHEDIAPQSRS